MFLTGFTSLSVLLIFPLSISPYLSLCLIFYFISSNIDEVLLIKPSANMFVFRDFSIYNEGWLTYHVELINLVNLLSSQTVFLKVLLLWISFFLLAPVFVLIKLLSSFHWLSIKFTVKYTFSSHSLWLLVGPVFKIIWEMLHGRISLNLWVDSCWNWCIYPSSYQIKFHSSPWFLAAYATAIFHRNHFFICVKRINLLNLKQSSDMLVIIAKGFLKLHTCIC